MTFHHVEVTSVARLLLTNFPPGPYDRFPARDFAHDVLAKCLGCCQYRNRALVGESDLNSADAKVVDLYIEFDDDHHGFPGRGFQAVPLIGFEILVAGLTHGWPVRKDVQPLWAGLLCLAAASTK